MSGERELGFLFDVDNTLLDNDGVKDYLTEQVRAALGEDGAERFWTLYEDVRHERDVVDLPLTARRYGEQRSDPAVTARLEEILDAVPFQRFLYPYALETLRHLASLGAVAILSDGDLVFQQRKIERSGLAAAVDGHVLIYTHKEDHLKEVAAFQPVEHSVLVDDKARILANVKRELGARVTTVHVLQGHYARDPLPEGFQADITVAAIGDLRAFDATRFHRA